MFCFEVVQAKVILGWNLFVAAMTPDQDLRANITTSVYRREILGSSVLYISTFAPTILDGHPRLANDLQSSSTLINIIVCPYSAAQGAMYAPLALKSVYGKRLFFGGFVLLKNFSQSTHQLNNSKSHDDSDWGVIKIKITHRHSCWGCHRWCCGFTRDRDHFPSSKASAETTS